MATRDDTSGLPIGEVLKRARGRQKLDIETVEQQTKIRTKYLRALENEEWDVLPGHPYAKGFLRTYAQLLGLDGDALVDEYRRTVESSLGADAPPQFTEPVLEQRRRLADLQRRRWPVRAGVVVALAAATVVGVLLVLGSLGNEQKGHHQKGKGHHHHSGGGGGQASGSAGSASTKPVTLALVTHDDMLVCLVPGHGQPLIDSQTLVAGSNEGPFVPPKENYRLDLEMGGAVTVTLDGKPQRIQSKGPASYNIDANGIQPTSFKGPNCP
jgi:helix-turn-helix protein